MCLERVEGECDRCAHVCSLCEAVWYICTVSLHGTNKQIISITSFLIIQSQ